MPSFFWTCDSISLSAGSYSPGDQTAVLSGSPNPNFAVAAARTSTNGLLLLPSTAQCQARFTTTEEDLCSASLGAIAFSMRLERAPVSATDLSMLSLVGKGGTTGGIYLVLTTTLTPRIAYMANGGTGYYQDINHTLSTSTWYGWYAGWDYANRRRRLGLFDQNNQVIAWAEDYSTTFSLCGTLGHTTGFRVGHSTNPSATWHCDTVMLSKSWTDPLWRNFTNNYSTYDSAVGAEVSASVALALAPLMALARGRVIAAPSALTFAEQAAILRHRIVNGAGALDFNFDGSGFGTGGGSPALDTIVRRQLTRLIRGDL